MAVAAAAAISMPREKSKKKFFMKSYRFFALIIHFLIF